MNKIKNPTLRIMFAGASGTGKTTLAKWLSSTTLAKGLSSKILTTPPFVSGSVSDLLPDTKSMSHMAMLSRDKDDLVKEDYQILNLRNKLYQGYAEKNDASFISDRSYIDSAAYFIYKQSDSQPQCEIEQFVSLCQMCLNKQCTHLVFLPFTMNMFYSWVTEDNNKRITSKFFQMEISRIMSMVMDIMGYRKLGYIDNIYESFLKNKSFEYGAEYGIIESAYGKTRVLFLNETNLENRKSLLLHFLNR